jgi:hypothetical protein
VEVPVHPSLRSLPLLGTLAAVAPLAAVAQSVPSVTLSRPEVRYEEPFDNVSGVRELHDGRVIVSDLFAKTVTLVDLTAGTGTAIGREGQGPNEFSFPIGIIGLPGDTTLVVDPGQRRFLRINPDGKPAGTIAFPSDGGMLQYKGADALGRIYFQGSPINRMAIDPNAPIPDSVPVLRWDRAKSRLDTLGKIKGPQMSMKVGKPGGNSRMIMMRQQPFSPSDDWSVAPDGRVAVARVADYRVEWWGANGRKVTGEPVKYARVPISQADKDEVAKAGANPRGRLVIGGGAGRAAPPPPPADDNIDWPAAKPPFAARTARMSPDGEFWVERSMPAGGAPTYDVFDASGRLARQVVLPKNARLVGFGAGSIYLSRSDEDDLQWLEKYRKL